MVDSIATDNSATTAEGNAIVIAVLANDSDADKEPLGIRIITPPANGSIAVNGDGTVTYIPGRASWGPTRLDTRSQLGPAAPIPPSTRKDTPVVRRRCPSPSTARSRTRTMAATRSWSRISATRGSPRSRSTSRRAVSRHGLRSLGAGRRHDQQAAEHQHRGQTGVVAPDGNTYIGAGGISGFEGIQVLFDPGSSGGFQPGETLGFSIDMDPNSIAGAEKFPLDSGSSPRWDVGGVSGAELIGSTFTVTFEDGTTATGQLQGVLDTATSNSQGGAQALATQRAHAGSVSLSVDGLVPAASAATAPAARRSSSPGRRERPRSSCSPRASSSRREHRSPNPMRAARRPAGCARRDAVPGQQRRRNAGPRGALTGSVQDITAMFDFTGVPIYGVADADQLPLAFVAGLVDRPGTCRSARSRRRST